MSTSALFKPLRVGNLVLSHRIVMAPMTRIRADGEGVHHELAIEHYGQRATPGGFLISEGTFILQEAGGIRNVPGIYTAAQISGWQPVTSKVHSKGGYIFCQLWALGRAASIDVIGPLGHKVVSASNLPMKNGTVPEPLDKEHIERYIKAYAQAATNAVEAGFDGVEVHNANGYLLDQFLQSNSNIRTDEYGGSIENRSLFSLKVVKAVVDAIGEERVGIRFSPFNTFQGMRMEDPYPTFTYVIREIRNLYPRLAYVHLVEGDPAQGDSTDFARRIWSPSDETSQSVFISCGGYTPETAEKIVTEKGGAVAFAKWFIGNPDLVARIQHGLELTIHDRKTVYVNGPKAYQGYTDYTTAILPESKL
ncbi:hypothetical protein FRB90_000498 [Tulasnella sp. 427]|nr:hypothetical protein FRB90_000498 [Tulasnella sp. 427]